MTMHFTELESKLQKTIKNNLTYRDLIQLCKLMKISCDGKKNNLQDRLILVIHQQNLESLTHIKHQIDSCVRDNNLRNRHSGSISISGNKSEYICDKLSQEVLNSALINIEKEVPQNLRNNLVICNFTSYSSQQTAVYIKYVPGINERANVVRIPNNLTYVSISKSPFYTSPVCLHPLSLLIPVTWPHVAQPNRITSRFNIIFYLSQQVYDLIKLHKLSDNKNRIHHKWQILLRFIAVDPSKDLPHPNENSLQTIPPYLTVSVNNNEGVQLWDILPSNCKAKEGRRHPKPVNITDKLNEKSRSSHGFRQSVTLTWWQTPDIFQYYYVGVYLERKYSVREIMGLFTSNRDENTLPVSETLKMIKSKLNNLDNSWAGGDDDMVIASVLPVSLSCPVGRSRMEVPVRTLKCQHLQCFDALLYLSMNERRSQWRCPVCDIKATPSELFRDKFFENILITYKDNDEINEVNVNAEGGFEPIKKRQRKHRDEEAVDNCSATANSGETKPATEQAMIVLDSDDEDEPVTKPNKLTSNKTQVAINPVQNKPLEKNEQPITAPKSPPVSISSSSSLVTVTSVPQNKVTSSTNALFPKAQVAPSPFSALSNALFNNPITQSNDNNPITTNKSTTQTTTVTSIFNTSNQPSSWIQSAKSTLISTSTTFPTTSTPIVANNFFNKTSSSSMSNPKDTSSLFTPKVDSSKNNFLSIEKLGKTTESQSLFKNNEVVKAPEFDFILNTSSNNQEKNTSPDPVLSPFLTAKSTVVTTSSLSSATNNKFSNVNITNNIFAKTHNSNISNNNPDRASQTQPSSPSSSSNSVASSSSSSSSHLSETPNCTSNDVDEDNKYKNNGDDDTRNVKPTTLKQNQSHIETPSVHSAFTIDLTLDDEENDKQERNDSPMINRSLKKPARIFSNNLHNSNDWVAITSSQFIRNSIRSSNNIPGSGNNRFSGNNFRRNINASISHAKLGNGISSSRNMNTSTKSNSPNINNTNNKNRQSLMTSSNVGTIDLTSDEEPPQKKMFAQRN